MPGPAPTRTIGLAGVVVICIVLAILALAPRGGQVGPERMAVPDTAAPTALPAANVHDQVPAKPATQPSPPAAATGIALAAGGSISDPARVRAIRATLAIIARGPPGPYRQDGVVFGNREGRLPREANGVYREFTVETPGSDDRGARRLVVGRDRVGWYSDDHYRSFSKLAEPVIAAPAWWDR
jgi:ribonuclease T1